MRFAFIAAAIALLSTSGIATNGSNVAPSKQWTVVEFSVPTRVGNHVLLGQYLLVHDDARMAKGEPCSAIYRFDPSRGPQERVVEFMCIPNHAAVTGSLQLKMKPEPGVSSAARVALVGYQFAGDSETHGVPATLR